MWYNYNESSVNLKSITAMDKRYESNGGKHGENRYFIRFYSSTNYKEYFEITYETQEKRDDEFNLINGKLKSLR